MLTNAPSESAYLNTDTRKGLLRITTYDAQEENVRTKSLVQRLRRQAFK